MTDLMYQALDNVARANEIGEWYRAARHGERVSLAYLVDHGKLIRRPWRGDGISRDSAFEYALPRYIGRELTTNGTERRTR